MYGINCLQQINTVFTVHQYRGFVQHECRCMQATIQDELHREDISSIVVNDLCAVPQPFLGLETEYKQTKYFKENFQLLIS